MFLGLNYDAPPLPLARKYEVGILSCIISLGTTTASQPPPPGPPVACKRELRVALSSII